MVIWKDWQDLLEIDADGGTIGFNSIAVLEKKGPGKTALVYVSE